jgi:general secretion pathway protein H
MCSALVPTGSPAVKATTRTSVPGNRPRRAAAGFTLLELMVVVVIVGVASAAVVLTLRDRSQSKLEEEGARLSALLETARTQSRIVGTDVRWQPLQTGSGFQFLGLPALAAKELPSRWLDPDTTATIVGAPQLLLGPEPLLPAQRVVLHLGERELAVGTDGLSPFQIVDASATVAAQ